MMVLLFFVFLITVLFAWTGFRSVARYGFGLTLLLAVIWFGHHITSGLGLQL